MKFLSKNSIVMVFIALLSAANLFAMDICLPQDVMRYIFSIYMEITLGHSFSFVDQVQLSENIDFLEFDNDSTSLNMANTGGKFSRWELYNKKFKEKLVVTFDNSIGHFAYDSFNKVALMGLTGITWFFDADGSSLCVHQIGRDHHANSSTFSPDGKLALVSYDSGGGIFLIDVPNKKALKHIQNNKNCLALAFSFDKKMMAFGADHQAVLHDLETGISFELSGKQISISHISFSNDGSKVLTVGFYREVLIWDSYKGELLGTLSGAELNEGLIRSALFSADDKVIITLLQNGTVHFWDAQNHQLIKSFKDMEGARYAWISANGENVAVLFEQHRLNVWRSFYAPETKEDVFKRLLQFGSLVI